jgi:2-octaprenyl-6-methoxyphenol hydroxylase
MHIETDIAIAGGGLNGTSLALSLASAGFRVALIDPRPVADRKVPEFDGRSYALALTSKRLLGALGLWDGLADNAQPILEIKVTDGRPGDGPSPMMLAFDHAEIEEGPMGYMVEDRYLRGALLDAADASSARIQMIEGSVGDHEADGAGVTLTLADGQMVRAAVLVGSDGRTGATAGRAGIRRQSWGYGQTALVCAIEHARPHNGVAHQFFMPAGPLAILPLTGNRSSIVWTESHEAAANIQALDDAAYLEVLRPRFGSFLGDIALGGRRWTYPLGLSVAERFIADRVALLGDAAHAMHPIAGQGLNAGLKDVAALAEVLADARRRGEDPGRGDVLERYQRWRRFDTAALLLATDSFNRLFSNDNAALRLVRDIGMEAVNAMPGLRRAGRTPAASPASRAASTATAPPEAPAFPRVEGAQHRQRVDQQLVIRLFQAVPVGRQRQRLEIPAQKVEKHLAVESPCHARAPRSAENPSQLTSQRR